MAEYYHYLEEYEAAVEFNRKALELVNAGIQKTGLTFERFVTCFSFMRGHDIDKENNRTEFPAELVTQ